MCVHLTLCFELSRTLQDLRQKASDDCGIVNEGSDSSDDIMEMVIEEPNNKWDCETILCELTTFTQDFVYLIEACNRIIVKVLHVIRLAHHPIQ